MKQVELNPAQLEAVIHGDAPLLVLAGAGTGKTTVVTRRIAHLIHERGVGPRQILAVTFTNKAAREMRERAARYADIEPGALDIGTFHGICGRLLRRFGQAIGLEPSFVIYDEADQLTLIRRCMAELKLDATVIAPQAVRHKIEQWKNAGQTPTQVQPTFIDPVARQAREIYLAYEKACLAANAVDFGDMLLHTVTLLRVDAGIRTTLQNRWSHVLVDEYQDTNPVQHLMLKLLVTPAHSFTAVGDDDQSIYRWRGADVGNILRFERDFPGARVVRLEQNYRSTERILAAANAVISHNTARMGKTLFTHGERGERLSLRIYESERDEGEAIGDRIVDNTESGRVPNDFAVLYRTNAQSRPIEDALRRRRLPYAVYGGIRFYDRREVKDALAYLKLMVNPRSDVDFLRTVNQPARGIGQKSLERLTGLALHKGVSLYEAATLAAAGEGELPTRARAKLAEFVELMDALREEAPHEHAARFLERLLEESGFLPALRLDTSPEAADRIDNLNELVTAVDEYVEHAAVPSLTAFIEEATLATDIDDLDPSQGRVTLMTMHSAKGLEFPIVFMPGMEEGLFPHSRSLEERAQLEEERRLCYVGITRAKEAVHLSAAVVRSVFGELRRTELSRFLVEVPEELLDVGERRVASRPAPAPQIRRKSESLSGQHWEPDDVAAGPPPPALAADDGFETGVRVFHATFGEGRVTSSEGMGPRKKLTIDFPGVGRKVIVAKFVERV
jgi:DNA helicase II / ATP-dependent DNA helicase PcrA